MTRTIPSSLLDETRCPQVASERRVLRLCRRRLRQDVPVRATVREQLVLVVGKVVLEELGDVVLPVRVATTSPL
jgi:hypothetical protein